MTIQSLPQDPAAIIASVEQYVDTLPAGRRRKRTHAEIYYPDLSEETENYGKLSLYDALCAGRQSNHDDPAQALLLSWEIQGRIAILYRNTYKTPESKAAREALPALVAELTTMAGGNDDATRRAVAIFWTLPFERQQAITYHRTGKFFKDEVEFKRYLGSVA